VVTNYHVISMAADLKVKIGIKVLNVEGVCMPTPKTIWQSSRLRAPVTPKVKIGDADKLKVGEKIYVIGSPPGS